MTAKTRGARRDSAASSRRGSAASITSRGSSGGGGGGESQGEALARKKQETAAFMADLKQQERRRASVAPEVGHNMNPKGGGAGTLKHSGFEKMGNFKSNPCLSDPTVGFAGAPTTLAEERRQRHSEASGARKSAINPKGGSHGGAGHEVGLNKIGTFKSGAWTKDPSIAGVSRTSTGGSRKKVLSGGGRRDDNMPDLFAFEPEKAAIAASVTGSGAKKMHRSRGTGAGHRSSPFGTEGAKLPDREKGRTILEPPVKGVNPLTGDGVVVDTSRARTHIPPSKKSEWGGIAAPPTSQPKPRGNAAAAALRHSSTAFSAGNETVQHAPTRVRSKKSNQSSASLLSFNASASSPTPKPRRAASSSPAAAQHASDASRLFGGGTPVVQTNSGRARMSTPR